MFFKTIFPFSGRFPFSIAGVFAVSLALLLIPLTAMQFTDAVQWSVADFLIMGVLLNGMGLLMLAVIKHKRFFARLAGIFTALTVFLLIWVNLAVGLVGSGPHWGNLLYIAVIAEILIGATISGFRIRGMMHTLFAATGILVVIACVQLLAGMEHLPSSLRMEIIGVNGFFAVLLFVCGWLYRVALKEVI